jgi:hypothetical protein
MPENVKDPRSFNPLFSLRWWFPTSLERWFVGGSIVVCILGLALLMWVTGWSTKKWDRVQKIAKEVEVEIQTANPVGSTKHDVEDWLKAHNFNFGPPHPIRPISIRKEGPLSLSESILTERGVSLKDATEYLEAHRHIGDGSHDETVVFLLFGSDGKLIRIHAEGFFISL